MIYNTTSHALIGYSMHYFIFGLESKLSIYFMLIMTSQDKVDDVEKWFKDDLDRLHESRVRAQLKLKR